ncbi:DUF5953 family protein [Corallococcus exiguus]|uniref:Uncharacterized protein n=1 Tax=Corallococcus exiguus TaxID=83462 RepID=A0A7X4Y8K9_9BACT|nr:DUF5953 family protein [Corallococcus exiguus]NBC40925.1 hypothetical protein [Corallococcus exiguus]TNV64859.1 hypothetical protein FH620_11340 [Corallococcus exiguus]
MAFMHNTLTVRIHAPAMIGADRRPLEMALGVERALPGTRLDWTVSDEQQVVRIPQRDAWLAKARSGGGFQLLCNNDEGRPVTLFGVDGPERLGPGGHALLEVHAELPLETSSLATALLENVAEAAHGYWGHATPFDSAVQASRQVRDPVRKPGSPPHGLPALKLTEQLRAPEIPHYLGWLNYWSEAAAQAIGFPGAARDAELLSRSRRTPAGGWVVQLTEAPLDYDNPEHIEALRRAYERFPVIGGRDSR